VEDWKEWVSFFFFYFSLPKSKNKIIKILHICSINNKILLKKYKFNYNFDFLVL